MDDRYIKLEVDRTEFVLGTLPSVEELFADYQEMVEAEYNRLNTPGTFDLPHSDTMDGIVGPKYLAARARTMKYWALEVARKKIEQSNEHSQTISVSSEFGGNRDDDRVLTMMALSLVYRENDSLTPEKQEKYAESLEDDILSPEARQKYATLLTILRMKGLIHIDLLKKYGLFESYLKASMAEVTV